MSLRGILSGVLAACIVTVVVLLGAAAATYFNFAGARAASVVVFGGIVLGVFVGAFSAAKKAGGKKLFNALSVIALFMAAMLCAVYALNGEIKLGAASGALLGSMAASGIVAALFA